MRLPSPGENGPRKEGQYFTLPEGSPAGLSKVFPFCASNKLSKKCPEILNRTFSIIQLITELRRFYFLGAFFLLVAKTDQQAGNVNHSREASKSGSNHIVCTYRKQSARLHFRYHIGIQNFEMNFKKLRKKIRGVLVALP